jgi:REP element-mobilizing transposase RayT
MLEHLLRLTGRRAIARVHVVWCLNYHRWIVGGRTARSCGELDARIAGECGWQIVAKHAVPYCIHVFVWRGRAYAEAAAGPAVKGRTARSRAKNFRPCIASPRSCVDSRISPRRSDTFRTLRLRHDIEDQWDAVIGA